MDSTRKYGLIGKQLDYSFSKSYFDKKFNNQTIKAYYLNFECNSIEEVKGVLNSNDLNGLNVTIPYKESIIPYLDELSDIAGKVGAVNTVQFKDGKKIGHNTDVYGFAQLIKPFFKAHHERAMILGTGGASKAVSYVLKQLGADVILISRKRSDAITFSYEDINDKMMQFMGVIVNTTPLGTYPDIGECPDIPYEFITDRHLVIDLIYNPTETTFLKRAKNQGAVTLNGKTMLEQQAEKSWEIWNE